MPWLQTTWSNVQKPPSHVFISINCLWQRSKNVQWGAITKTLPTTILTGFNVQMETNHVEIYCEMAIFSCTII
jgi:hypothetical protein